MAKNQNAEPVAQQDEELSESMKHERDSDHPFHQDSENAQAVSGGVTADPQINPSNPKVADAEPVTASAPKPTAPTTTTSTKSTTTTNSSS